MRRFLALVLIIAVVAVVYSVFSDPERKAKVMGTIEGSTGVDLSVEPEQILEDTGKVIGDAADQALKGLGDTLTDPAFYDSLEKWGRSALDKLDAADLDRLKQDLENEAGKSGADYDSVLEKYLGKAVDS